MNAVFKKLQLKEQNPILIFNSPKEFNDAMEEMKGIVKIDKKTAKGKKYDFLLFFATLYKEILKYSELLKDLMNEGATLWFAYPKKSSKKYKSELYRDEGWQPLGDLGFEPVRLIAIDEDWSAVRFKPADKIKNFSRDKSLALSEKGKARR